MVEATPLEVPVEGPVLSMVGHALALLSEIVRHVIELIFLALLLVPIFTFLAVGAYILVAFFTGELQHLFIAATLFGKALGGLVLLAIYIFVLGFAIAICDRLKKFGKVRTFCTKKAK